MNRPDLLCRPNCRSTFVCCFLLFLSCFYHTFSFGQIRQIREELHRLSAVNDSTDKVNSLIRLGTLYRTRNTDSCLYYGMEAKRLAAHIHYEKGQSEADHLVAFTLFKRGLYAESMELYGQLLPYYKQHADTLNMVRLYLDKAEALNKGLADKREVVALLQQAIRTASSLKNDSILADVYISYCNRNGNLSPDSIRFYLGKAQDIATHYNDRRALNFVRMWQLRLKIINGQKQGMLPLLKQHLTASRHMGNVNQEINALFLLVIYYEDHPKVALDYYDQARMAALNSGDKSLEIYILTNALTIAKHLDNKDELIRIHQELQKAWIADWENTKRFISDYVRFNTMQVNNKRLSEKNAQRALWLAMISALAVVTVLAIYLTMLHRDRKAKTQIAALNETANMQIIAMEEAKHQAIKEEQQRLGQDLHDGLSASIASIKHQVELLYLDTEDAPLKHRLNTLQSAVTNAYETTRNKSHEWFSSAGEREEQLFEERIKLLTEHALPDSRYQKNIHIDNHSLARVNADTRISLLRIIQEAMTNIIKHARAKHVSILIYEEVDQLLMVISDDGKGLGDKKPNKGKSTIGLQSIQRRVQYLNGNLIIASSMSGTELRVSIPLTPTLS